jgi:hypothetical protein
MRLVRTLSLVMVLAFAGRASADDKKPAAPPAKDTPPAAAEASPADVDKFLAFWDKLVDTIVADKDSCPKMATDINALIDGNKDLLAKAGEAAKAGKKLPKTAEDHMMAGVKKMMPAMQKCQSDKAVQAAFQRLDVGAHKKNDVTPPKTK